MRGLKNTAARLRTIAVLKGVSLLDKVTEAGKDVAMDSTPVDTGRGKRSWHRVVITTNGAKVAGDGTDGNGNPVPDYSGFDGLVIGIVASNEIAATGRAYLRFVNDGTRGRSGAQMTQRARAAMDAARRRG